MRNEAQESVIVFDSNEQEESRESDLPEGKYTWDIILPKGVLKPDKYYFYANFTSHFNQTGFNVDSPSECCCFEVVDTITKRGRERGAITSIIPKIKKIPL